MEARIYIRGPIGSVKGKQGVNLAEVISQFKKQPGATSLIVEIDSPGGNLQTGFDIYNFLKSTGLPITTIGRGTVASVATIVFMAGQIRKLQKGTQFMIHLPRLPLMVDATADDMDRVSKEMKIVEKRVITFYSKELNIDQEAVASLLKEETFLDEGKAFSLGFTTSEEVLDAVALLEIDNQKPEKMSQEKTKTLAKKITDLITNFLGSTDDAEMKIVLTADQEELNFPDLADADAIEPGARAEINGEPANGEYIDADGNTLVFTDGVLDSITEASEEDEEATDEEMEALKKELDIANAKVMDLTQEVENLKKENKTHQKEVEQARNVVKEVQALQSQMIASIGEPKPRNPGEDSPEETESQKALKSYAERRKQARS